MNRAAEILERLRGLGNNYNPDKQRYKADLNGERITLYKPDGSPFDCAAAEMELYVEKGFTCEEPAPPKAAKK